MRILAIAEIPLGIEATGRYVVAVVLRLLVGAAGWPAETALRRGGRNARWRSGRFLRLVVRRDVRNANPDARCEMPQGH